MAVPCYSVETDLDLWVAPLWRNSLFFSNRRAEALSGVADPDKLLSAPCREASPDERERNLSIGSRRSSFLLFLDDKRAAFTLKALKGLIYLTASIGPFARPWMN